MEILKYDQLITTEVAVKNKTITVPYIRSDYEHQNYLLYYDENGAGLSNPKEVFYLNTELKYILPAGTKLYFSPKSTMPRDYVRNTHKIVRDPDKAEYIVVPDLTERMDSFGYQILFSCSNGITKYVVKTTFTYETAKKNVINNKEVTLDEVIQAVINRINHGYLKPEYFIKLSEYELLDTIDLSLLYDFRTCELVRHSAWIVPNLPEYEDILKHSSTTLYVRDYLVNYSNPTELTAEMLYVMRKNTDREIVLRSIATTNWREYPFTTAVFLFSYYKDYEIYNSGVPSGARFMVTCLEVSKYNNWRRFSKNLNVELVSPEDLAMLQDWLFKEMNISGNCGYVDFDIYDSLPTPMKDCLRKKMAVSKIKSTQPVMIQDIKQSC